MHEFVGTWLTHTWEVTRQAAPWLVFGFFLAGLIHVWVPVEKVAAHLGRRTFGGVLKAALLGAPLPLCSCSVIPVASSLRRSGASRGATAAFLVSTPETGVDSISVTYALLGPVMAVLRPVAALLSAVTAGGLINRLDPQRERAPAALQLQTTGGGTPEKPTCPHCAPAATAARTAQPPTSNHSDSPAGLASRLGVALRYGYVDMFVDLSIWLVIGFFLAGLVSAIVPEGFLETHVGSGWLAMLLVLAIALPFYVCATSSTPIAAALIAKGLSPGAALVFLLAGPATNIATMVVVGKELGRRSLVIYLISIVTVAVALGLLVDLVPGLPVLATAHAGHDHGTASGSSSVAAVVFTLLVLNGLRGRYRRRTRSTATPDAQPVPTVAQPACHHS
ncbi:MAG: SO_0444 family Cu/Zn efflux transporter [Planctomycetes bacterium]|nr:SO_0444 family Cu/Zn efflux transporter [Planctomycetota bacterium]